MLMNLHVKNLALIEETEVEFTDGLNILTGETGAGKSILIGSINLALGQKVSKDMIRNGADSALVELVFETKDDDIKKYFEEHEMDFADGQIILSRKITNTKNIAKVNGETVSLSVLKEISGMLLELHGQHDNESLLKTSMHLKMIDDYGKDEMKACREQLSSAYKIYQECKKKMQEFSADEEERLREISFLEFEVREIEEAAFTPGEDEELEEEYRMLSNSEKIAAGLSQVYEWLDEGEHNICDLIGRCVKNLSELSGFDGRISSFCDSASDIEALCSDLAREVAGLRQDLVFDGERTQFVEKRLDLINRMKLKYGRTLQEIEEHRRQAAEKLEFYRNFEEEKEKTEQEFEKAEKQVAALCDKLHNYRKDAASEMGQKIVEALQGLNFLEVKFETEFQRTESYSVNGNDEVQFLISTNPGEWLPAVNCPGSCWDLKQSLRERTEWKP